MTGVSYKAFIILLLCTCRGGRQPGKTSRLSIKMLCIPMKCTPIHKHDIAIEFIVTAIRLYDEGTYISALHLAGAAEEIFHDTLKDRGIEPTKETSSRLAKKLGDVTYKQQPSRPGIETVMDTPKNSVKHVSKNNEYIYETMLRPQVDAFRMIRRAIKNARLADICLGQIANQFMSRNELDIHNA